VARRSPGLFPGDCAARRLSALFLLLAFTPGCAPEPDASGRPHVILVTLESLRTDHVGAYGGGTASRRDVSPTPALDAFAAGATVYERAHSVTSWTLASHASLFTGLYPTAHGTEGPRDCLDDSYTTLAERLAKAGYQTAGVVSGPYLRPMHRLHQGFELYDDSPASITNAVAHDDITNPAMEESLQRVLEEQRDSERPLFLFAYFWDPHYDYIPPAPFDAMFVGPEDQPVDARGFETNAAIHAGMPGEQVRWLLSQYAGEIRWTDDALGRFFAQLQRLGLWDDALVIVTADHGEEFFDHGEKGHKNNLHAETVRVPLLVKLPGQREGRRDPRLVSLVDVAPTVLEVIGLEVPADAFQGRSLLAPEAADRPVFFELLSVVFLRDAAGELFTRESLHGGVEQAGRKLLWNDTGRGGGLFDVENDPGERAPLAGTVAERNRLRAAFDGEMARSRAIAERHHRCGEARLSREEIEVLCALGYLTDCD
jgi:arylsulfatase A-like enzyme